MASELPASPEEHEARIRRNFEQLMEKKPVAVVMHALAENGDVFTAAAGSPINVLHVDEVGFHQLIDMLRKGAEAAERNG